MDGQSIVIVLAIFIFFACVLRMILTLSANKGAGFKKYFAIMRIERSEQRARRKIKKRKSK